MMQVIQEDQLPVLLEQAHSLYRYRENLQANLDKVDASIKATNDAIDKIRQAQQDVKAKQEAEAQSQEEG